MEMSPPTNIDESAATSPPYPYPPYQTHSWRLLFGDEYEARERSLVRFVVDAVGRPLKRFKSTRELVEAVRDAIEGTSTLYIVLPRELT